MSARLSLIGGLVLAGAVNVETAIVAGDAGPNPVTHWNTVAVEIVPVDPGPILDGRALAILHAAVHDAVNGVERRFEPYTADVSAPGASVEAAVAAAARDVLVALAPSQRERIEAEYAAALAAVPDGPAENDGVALGRQCAQATLDRRAGDGIPAGPWPPQTGPVTEPVYAPTGRPGDYDFTPPFDGPPLGPIALFPGWGRLRPFAIDLARHRPPGPPSLRSREYAQDVKRVKSIGRLESRTRTRDQTEIAFFWFEGLATWNRIATTVLAQERADAWQAARVLALMNMAVADGDIAVFDAKYRFRFWRPYTAIRRAGEDGNRLTEPDEDWLPLLWTAPEVIPPTFFIPPIPEYPSAAALLSAAAAEVLIRSLGDRHRFTATSETLPGVTRRFDSFSEAALETGLSRVYGGIHFPRAVDDGREQGRSIGRAVSRLLPRVQRRSGTIGPCPGRSSSSVSPKPSGTSRPCATSPSRSAPASS